MKRRIMVIGLDGATWNILRPRMAAGQMPNLKRLVEAGASGEMDSIFPPETPAAWPSFMTGKNPGKHGAFDFLVYNPETKRERPVNSTLRQGKTIWEYLHDAGKTCLVLNVPTTYPVVPIRGAMISDFLTPGDARDYAHPIELVDELEREYGRYPLFFETQSFVCAHSEKNATMFLDELESMDRTKFEVCEKLFDRYQPDFTMLHIWGTDRLQHELWNWFDPEHPKWDPKMAEKFGPRIDAYYKMCDDYVGRLAAKVGEDGITFVISDHGFGPTHYFIDLNSWLLREGFIVLKNTLRVRLKKLLWDLGVTPQNATRLFYPFFRFWALWKAKPPEAGLQKSSGTLAIPGMLNLRTDVDWRRTRAYAPFGWSGIFINTAGIRPNGSVAPEDYTTIRDEIVARLKDLTNPDTGKPVGGPIHIKEEMYKGPYTPWGPDVMPLPLNEKHMPVCFFGFQSKDPVYPNNTLYGNHQMAGVFTACGQGVRPGTIRKCRLYDMAPTVLYLLGLPVPDDMDGKVVEDAIDPRELAQRPIQTLHTEGLGEHVKAGLTAEEEEELRARLEGLGYL
ncbi:MAG: alkaline phosphatase family protein [Candidatus Hydrogenedentes bacterium]|nr:alkaline phosphatase family protein [Candidatus Hydrogenedentota bacterium]